MAESNFNFGEIIPSHAYTLPNLAKQWGVTTRWIKEELLETGELQFTSKGKFLVIIMGWAIIAWVENHGQVKEDKGKSNLTRK